MELNPAQAEAVHTLSGPLLVLAGAGTGKTRVVTYRIAELIRRRTPPDRILAVTFTNKAADEMQQRSAAILGKRLPRKPEISTFHSLCVRILRRHITQLGYPAAFAIYDRGDQEGVARTVLREIKAAEGLLRPGELLWFIGRWKTACVRPEQAAALAQSDKEHLAASGYRRYQKALQAAGAVDFDDLLLCVEQLFTRFPKVRAAEAARFDHLLVDEYQDTNGSQYRIVKALAGGHRNLCVVGDDDQSIYGWRGAEVAHILGFKKDWPDAKIVRLETNYRSTREIVAWANRLIAFNRLRHARTLRASVSGQPPRVLQLEDETKEAKAVVEEIAAAVRQEPPPPARLRRPLPHERAAAGVRVGAAPREDPLRPPRRHVLLRPQGSPRRARLFQGPRQSGRRGLAAADHQHAAAGHRASRGEAAPGAGHRQRRKPLWEVLPEADAPAVAKFRDMIGQFQQRVEKGPLPAAVRELIAKIAYRDEIVRLYPDANDQREPLAVDRGGGQRRGGLLPSGRSSRRWPDSCRTSPWPAPSRTRTRNRNWSGTPWR